MKNWMHIFCWRLRIFLAMYVVTYSCISTSLYYCTPIIVSQPLLREAYEKNGNMDQGEARRTLEQCLRVLYYRDCRTINKVITPQIATRI